MYRDYKIVVNTAAGRRRYMQYLVPFVVSTGIVDRYDIWINTHNGADIEFFKLLAEKYPVINLMWQPEGYVCGNGSINAFYRQCVDIDTIYLKLDDDIVWMEDDAIQRMADFRIDNPHYFLVSPLVINNSLSTYILQVKGKISLDRYYKIIHAHPILWRSGKFALQLHEWFLRHITRGDYDTLHVGKCEMGETRFSINAIMWFGRDMARFDGIVPGNDEEFLSCTYPTSLGVANCWNGDVIMSHFAFYTQRKKLDRQSILEQYGKILHTKWAADATMRKYLEDMQGIMSDIERRRSELEARQSPYNRVPPSAIPETPLSSFANSMQRLLPRFVRRLYRSAKKRIARIGKPYILDDK